MTAFHSTAPGNTAQSSNWIPKGALLLFYVFASTASLAQSITQKAVSDDIILMPEREPAMKKAFDRARATLPEFFRIAKSPPDSTSSYALKVAISDGKNTEYFWVNQFTEGKEGFSGVLNNEPRLVKKHAFGERISFVREQIVDWTYVDRAARRTFGNFTACALLTKEPPAEAAAFKRQLGLNCDWMTGQ